MSEYLTTQLVAEEMQKLVVAFPGNHAAKTSPMLLADTYRNGLRGLDGAAVRAAVDRCIREDTYFPKIARLREAAAEWTRRTNPVMAQRQEAAWHTCPVCGATATSRMLTRPKRYRDADGDYFRTVKPSAAADGSRLEAGRRVPVRDLLDAMARGVALELETVASQSLYLDHRPEAHHVHPDPDTDA